MWKPPWRRTSFWSSSTTMRFSIISYRKQLSIIPKTYVSLSCPRQTNSWVNAFFFFLFLLEYHMSPLGRAAYSREVKALPSSYHTGCAQTRQFERKSDTCRNGHLETHFCGWFGGGELFQLTSLLFFFSLIGDGQCHRVQWGNPLRCSVFKSPFGYNGCDVAQLLDPRWMNICALRCRELLPTSRRRRVGITWRSSLIAWNSWPTRLSGGECLFYCCGLVSRISVEAGCCCCSWFDIVMCRKGRATFFLRNYLQSLASFRKVKSRNYTCPHDTCTLIFNDL